MNKSLLLLGLLCVSMVVVAADSDKASDQLVRQIQQMENSVRKEQLDHDSLHATQDGQCAEDIAFRNSEVTDAKAAFGASQDSLGRCENAKTASQADLGRAEKYVSDIENIVQGLRSQRNTEERAFNATIYDELDPAIAAVNGVYPILDEIVVSQSPSSFVQLNSHVNKAFLQMLKAQKTTQFGVILISLLEVSPAGVTRNTTPFILELTFLLPAPAQRNRSTDSPSSSMTCWKI